MTKRKRKRHISRKGKIFLACFFVLLLIVISILFKIFSDKDVEEIVEINNNVFNIEKYDIKLDKELIYLVVDEEKQINSNVLDVSYDSDDKNIASVDSNGVVKGVGVGETTIYARKSNSYASLKVIVTDLVSKPVVDNKKEKLTCNKYSEEESTLLDNYLEYKVNEAGYLTRAGVVEAARFLTLEFKYRINYFYENGRLYTEGGRTYADGEGRYYHKGLFLSESKFTDLVASNRGPAIWGCPMYEGITGKTTANGLDCSGFVTWAMVNAGYDPKDIGAGISSAYDLSDLGEKLNITKDNLNSDKYKVGDLMSRNQHIGIIIGIEDDIFYIAESLDTDLHVQVLTKDKLLKSDWKYIILMDDFYQNDGNISNMWE